MAENGIVVYRENCSEEQTELWKGYPNGHSEGAPFEHYGPLQSEKAIQYASHFYAVISPLHI
jgi:hypothetical protein